MFQEDAELACSTTFKTIQMKIVIRVVVGVWFDLAAYSLQLKTSNSTMNKASFMVAIVKNGASERNLYKLTSI